MKKILKEKTSKVPCMNSGVSRHDWQTFAALKAEPKRIK